MKKIGLIYLKLFRLNDSPQRIALGLGLGVTLGIMPLTGPIAALFLATFLRLNRASALLGSLLTNTWLSMATFLLSIKVGSSLTGLNWQSVYVSWKLFLKNFHWLDLFKITILKAMLPLIVGYIIVAFCLGFMVYLITIVILVQIKYAKNKSRWRNL